jgi:hypothetical protein
MEDVIMKKQKSITTNFIKLLPLKNADLIAITSFLLQGCWFITVDKPSSSSSSSAATTTVLGQSLGNRAGSQIDAQLSALRGMSTTHMPAAIRPDPDTYVRSLLLQYRPKGATLAREIGRVESYRLLMGGAPEDFSKDPSSEYDATSFLAMFKVNQELCTALVAPTAEEHPGWESILPAPPESLSTNLTFLAQRFLGKPSDQIDSSILTSLQTIIDNANTGSSYTYESYIPACLALSMDAEAALL